MSGAAPDLSGARPAHRTVDAFHAREGGVHHEAELLVQRLSRGCRVQTHGVDVGHRLEPPVEERHADALPACVGSYQHHRDPRQLWLVADGGHRANHLAAPLGYGDAVRVETKELLPVARDLVPVALTAEPQSRLHICRRHRTEQHA